MLDKIRQECSQFLQETNVPIYKLVNISTSPISKIKVRTSTKTPLFGEFLDESMTEYSHKLYNRTIFCSSVPPVEPPQMETAIIFVPDHYRYFHSTVNHKLRENFDQFILQSYNLEIDIYQLLSDAYTNEYTINECAQRSSEIGFYSVPYYYAVRLRYFHDYRKIINLINGL